jgi:hypothetical protein
MSLAISRFQSGLGQPIASQKGAETTGSVAFVGPKVQPLFGGNKSAETTGSVASNSFPGLSPVSGSSAGSGAGSGSSGSGFSMYA